MEELKNMNLHGLFRFLHMSDSDFENWLKDNKLLFRQRKCECGRDMAYKWNHARPNNPLWVCNSKKNHGRKTPTRGYYDATFFLDPI